jgi:hypothetical protein
MKAQKLALAIALGVGGGLWASLPGQALAAGNVDSASGEATVASPGGKPRALAKGDRVQAGDTIATGADGAVLITTDDSGVLAVRARSRLTIEAYKVNGNEQDSVVLSLLRGSLRSITGWISKTAPKNYKITTATATVGIRGTDHEVAVGEGSEAKADAPAEDDSGTWNQVTEGATTLATPAGELVQQAGTPSATGRVKTAGAAPLQALAPPTLFKPQPTDARTTELKKDAQTNQQQRLDTRKQQVAAAGGSTAQGNTAVSTQCAPNAPAQKALDDLIRAYEQGDIAFLQQRLSPSMVGYSTLINDVQTSTNAQRQTRIQIKDRQMQCGPDVSSITFSWEKTFLDAVSFQPGIVRGTGSVLLSGLSGGQWQVSGLAGSTPFVPSGGTSTDGSVSVSVPAINFTTNNSGCTQALLNGTAVADQVGPGPQYAVGSFAYGATTCLASLSTAGSNACRLLVAVPPTAGSFIPAVLAPGNPALTTCNVSYSSTPLVTGSVGSSILQLNVTTGAPQISFTGLPGTNLPLVAPISFRQTSIVNLAGGVTASITVQTAVGDCSNSGYALPLVTAPPVCVATPSTLNAAIEVRDADVTASSLQVLVSSSNGDAENFVLPRVSAGVYRLNTLPIARGGSAVLPGNGRIDLPASTVAESAVNLTIKYNDARSTTGANVIRQTTLQLIP